MKKAFSVFLALMLVLLVIPCESAHAVEYLTIVSRDDGTWLWPLSETAYYESCSDWAGCNSNGSSGICPFHGYHCYNCSANHTTDNGYGHNGMDVGVSYGTAVYAMADGTAYCVDYNHDSRGYTLVIEHAIDGEWSYYSYYQHLQGVDTALNGKTVKAGDTVAYSGNSAGYGSSGDSHLHFGIVMGPSGAGSRLASAPNNKDTGLSWLENCGWITEQGLQNGRILNNPAENIPYVSKTSDSLMAHPGSVHYTFDANKVSVSSYLSQCKFYPSYMTVEAVNIEDDTYIWTLPCISQTDEHSEIIRRPKKGETLTVTGIFRNSVGNHYWYRINVDGQVGYIWPTVVKNGDAIYDDVTISNVQTPSSLSVGSRFSLRGEISTKYNVIQYLHADIIRTSDNTTVCSWEQEINAGHYSIYNSDLDMAMLFNELPAGEYQLEIWADIPSYSTVKGNDLFHGGICKTFVRDYFTVS